MSSSSAANINPKDCVYGCNTRIYWNTLTSEYWEVLTKRKHICPNRSNNNNKSITVPTDNKTISKPTQYNNNYKTNYNNNYNYKKSWTSKFNNKPSMDNSLEILQGSSTDTIRKQYEVLSDLIREYNGKTHGSQSHILANNSIQLIVYYEVPEGMREEIKRKFENFIRNEIKIYHSHHHQQQ